MSAGVQVDVDLQPLMRTLSVLRGAFSSRTYLKLVGTAVLYWINENFRSGGSEHPWQPLAASTLAARRQGGGSGGSQILRDTGRLAQSFVRASGPQGKLSGDAVWVGTADERAVYHHFGTRPFTIRPKGGRGVLRIPTPDGVVYRRFPTKAGKEGAAHPGLPARPLLPSLRLAERLALQTLQGYVDELTAQANATT